MPGGGPRLVEGPLPVLAGIDPDLQPGLAVLIDDAGDVRPGDGGLVPGAVVVEHMEDLTQLMAGLGRHGPDRAGGAGGLLRVKIGTTGQGCGMQRDQGDALGQGVVHLA